MTSSCLCASIKILLHFSRSNNLQNALYYVLVIEPTPYENSETKKKVEEKKKKHYTRYISCVYVLYMDMVKYNFACAHFRVNILTCPPLSIQYSTPQFDPTDIITLFHNAAQRNFRIYSIITMIKKIHNK